MSDFNPPYYTKNADGSFTLVDTQKAEFELSSANRVPRKVALDIAVDRFLSWQLPKASTNYERHLDERLDPD